MRTFSATILTLTLVAGCASTRLPEQADSPPPQPRNVILFVADGFSLSNATLARDYVRWREGQSRLTLDGILTGAVHTHAANSRVTDSAAGATAYACGLKTDNGVVGMDATGKPCLTVLEAARARGWATGLVATSRITHATPASFASHVPDRAMEAAIATEIMGAGIDVILGGGVSNLVPAGVGGLRQDGRNLVQEALDAGYQFVNNEPALVAAKQTPLLGLFADVHLNYEIDRAGTGQPDLATMARKSMELLAARSNGFFLMIEASRIDHAGHDNDLATLVHEVVAYDRAMEEVLAFARRDGRTLVVGVSDHETGGMAIGDHVGGELVYAWNPDALATVGGSIEQLMKAIPVDTAAVRTALQAWSGYNDLDSTEVARVANAPSQAAKEAAVGAIVDRRALAGWTTTHHTAVDVPMYAYGPGAHEFVGSLDNAEVGRRLMQIVRGTP